MSQSPYRVRRATVDDLAALLALWEAMHFPVANLERRLTEFQLVETQDGKLLGALGLEVIGRHGRLHSEAFTDFALADPLRELLWERMQSLAANFGLARLWTAESAPFWKQHSFRPANAAALKTMTPPWTFLDCHWLTVELRDEEALKQGLEKDFSRLQQEERQRTERTLRRAKAWNRVAIALALIVALAGVIFCIYLLSHHSNLFRR
jgi:N-acetylglutamate synthase-like GNAT family acetyltransferase